ncbi:MAG: DNA recombination protein RmuC, partial [Clostridia bacterium]|nr:DNA recombination protein RmuC [Clostridia bacterium]
MLLAVITVLLLILIVLVFKFRNNPYTAERLTEIKLQNEALSRGFSGEFERSRRENADFQHRVSNEMNRSYVHTTESISKLKDSNYENIIRLNESISSSLNQIKDSNAEQNEKQTRIIGEALSKMQESNEKRLDQMRATVDEKLNETLGSRLDSSFKTVSQQLENVYKSLGEMKELSNGVTTNVSSLNRVLTNVKARGTWAEVQLEGILDQTIPNMYVKNFASDSSSQKRVEFAVKFPSNDGSEVYLPIDSKFPMEDYVRLCSAADSADADAVKAARKALEDRVL